MRYRPDTKLSKAKEVIKSLDLKNERDELIFYYISHLETRMDKQDEKLKKYRSFFELLGELIPKSGRDIIYGG